MNKLLPVFILFPLLVANLQVRTPYYITSIARNTLFVLIIVVFQGGCCQIFHIWNNRILCCLFWNLYCWIFILITIRTISILFSIHFIWTFLTHLWKVATYLLYGSPPESLSLPLWRIFKSVLFIVFMTGHSISQRENS